MNTFKPREQQEPENAIFAKLIAEYKEEIIPVVCDDMIEYVTAKGSFTIYEFIWEQYKELIDKKDANLIHHYITSNFYYGITCLEQIINRNGFSKILYEKIQNGFETGKLRLREEVKTFLKRGQFPLIITTLGFTVIEESVYGAKSDIDKEKYSIWYNPNKRNDLPLASPTGHIVYHIFGGESFWPWVYNEQTLLNFMHAFHSVDFGAKNLFNRINKNVEINQSPYQLLVLGSILPDWLFRFLIYPLYKDNIAKSGGMWLSLDSITIELSSFLERNKYLKKTNIRSTETEQLPQLLNIPDSDNLPIASKEIHNVFISYKRGGSTANELKQIDRIVAILKSQVGDCWIDTGENPEKGKKNIQKGDNYWDVIKNAINERTLFVPIVNWAYLDEFEGVYVKKDEGVDETTLRPVVREAFYALKRLENHERMAIFPIVMKYSEKDGNVEELAPSIVEDKYKEKLSNPSENWMTPFLTPRDLEFYDDKNPQLFRLPILNEL